MILQIYEFISYRSKIMNLWYQISMSEFRGYIM